MTFLNLAWINKTWNISAYNVQQPPENTWDKLLRTITTLLHAPSILSGRQTSAQHLHAQMNRNRILHDLSWTWQPPEDHLKSHRPNICRLVPFYLHIHLPFSVFESEVMQTCVCQCVRELCESCLLRWWIKQQVHLICKTPQGKYTKWHTYAYTGLHIASK